MDPVGRVDVDEDDPRPRRGQLGDHPLGIVRRPDPEPVASFDAERDEASGERVDAGLKLPIRPAHPLLADDERLAIGGTRDDAVEGFADRLTEQRLRRRAMRIASGELRHLPALRVSYTGAITGSAQWNVAPPSGLFSARIEPPWSVTIERLMASPRPRP